MNFKLKKAEELKQGDVILNKDNHLLKIEMIRDYSGTERGFYFTNQEREFINNETLLRTFEYGI